MNAVGKESPFEHSQPQLGLYDPDAELERRYDRFLAKTGDPVAASIMASATVIARKPSTGKIESRDVFTPPQVARQLGVDPATVLDWIRTGQLKASNVGKGGQRPRFRIKQSDLDAFLKSRQPEPRAKRKRRIKEPAGDMEFFS